MVKHDVKIISFNVRGLNNVKKRTSIYSYLKNNQCDIAFLQETYSDKANEQRWIQEWEGSGYMVHGTKHSQGVAVLFCKGLDVDVIKTKLDFKGRFIILHVKINDEKFNLINIYAPNRDKEQLEFIDDLLRVLNIENILTSDNNIFAGDWNVVMSGMDKLGGIEAVKEKTYAKLKELVEKYELIDIWRLKNVNKKKYTWRQNRPRIHCRLDYFLISHHLNDLVINTNILPSLLSFHSPISLSLKYIEEPIKGTGHWKLNLSLLKEDNFKIKLKEKILLWKDEHKDIIDKNLQWEIIKYEIRRFSIKYSGAKKRGNQEMKTVLEKKLSDLEEKEHLGEEHIYLEIEELRSQINNFAIEEAQGSIIRSRTRWVEEGEKSTAYFFNLEKQNSIKKNIRKIIHNGIEETNQQNILNNLMEYYKTLYDSQPVEKDNEKILSHPSIPQLSEAESMLCEGAITLEECTKVMKTFAKNTTPGNDGLQIEFYSEFWPELGPMLELKFNYCFENNLITTSQRQAVISILDKNGKHRLYLDNCRPISLLNVDYKLMSKCIAERMKNVLDNLIDHSQTGFLKGRNISDGLRTILDVMDETSLSNKHGLLVTIDFEKAFDSLSWDFLFQALRKYNFGTDLLKWVRLCYTDISSCVINYKRSSPYFKVKRGVRQGDPLSPYLFILVVEIMSIGIRNNKEIRGLKYNKNEIKIISYADDTTALLQDETDAKKLITFLKKFERISGLKMNKNKTEGLWLGTDKDSQNKPLGIKWPKIVKVLGIHLCYDKNEMEEKNFKEKIAKMKRNLNLWKQRDLTIYGKILLLKTFALSQLTYISNIFHTPDNFIHEIEELMYNFLWNGKSHKVKKNVIIQNYEHGGGKMIDIKTQLKVKNISWIKRFFDEKVPH